jgi:nucleoid DNA-binding protein
MASLTDLVDVLATNGELTKTAAREQVDQVFDGLVALLQSEGKVTIRGFGTFVNKL